MANFTDKEVIKDIIDRYENKESCYEIAERYNTYPGKIRNLLMKNGVKIRSKKEAQKIAIKKGRSKHPTKGKKHSEETKRKISISRHKAWLEMPEEEKKEFCKAASKRWHALPTSKKVEMQQLAGAALHKSSIEGSKAEKFLYDKLIEDEHRVVLHDKELIEGGYEVDLYLPDLLTIIEIDGPQHFLPVFGEDSLKKTIGYDSTKNGVILGQGFAIIRVKYLANKISDRVKRDLYDAVSTEIEKIEKKFPPEGKRLIEVEVQ